jgi:hypothetical protein
MGSMAWWWETLVIRVCASCSGSDFVSAGIIPLSRADGAAPQNKLRKIYAGQWRAYSTFIGPGAKMPHPFRTT